MDHPMKSIEQEIHRFIQIRNEIQEEVNKIPPCVASLQETGKLLVSHFEVFRQISKNTQDQMPSIIQAASQTMAKTISDEASQLIRHTLEEKITALVNPLRTQVKSSTKQWGQRIGNFSCYRYLDFY